MVDFQTKPHDMLSVYTATRLRGADNFAQLGVNGSACWRHVYSASPAAIAWYRGESARVDTAIMRDGHCLGRRVYTVARGVVPY